MQARIALEAAKTDLQIRYNCFMTSTPSLDRACDLLFQDAIQRDLTTSRRFALLEILWHERYLTREQLITRVELRLGKRCFGSRAWADTFYRDLRVVRRALAAGGYQLSYSRRPSRRGYHLRGQPALSDELRQTLSGSAGEADQRQIDIYRRLSAAERFRQGCATSDTARNSVAHRIRQEDPGLSLAEAQVIALQRAYGQA